MCRIAFFLLSSCSPLIHFIVNDLSYRLCFICMVVRKRVFISVRLSDCSSLYFKAEIIKVSIKLNYNRAETLKHPHDDSQQWRNKPSFIHHFSSDGSQNKNHWSIVTSDVLALFKWSSSLQLGWTITRVLSLQSVGAHTRWLWRLSRF